MKKSLVLLVLLFFAIVGVANANLITNGDCETGDLAGWESEDVSVVDLGGSYGYVAILNDDNSFGHAKLSQEFYIGAGTTSVNISFDYLFTGTDTSWLNDSAKSDLSYRIGDEEFSFMWLTWTEEQWLDESLFNATSSDASFGTVINFSANIDISPELMDIDPNAGIYFSLLETRSFCSDGTDTALYLDNVDVAPVPEPATLVLLGSGLAGLAFYRRKRK